LNFFDSVDFRNKPHAANLSKDRINITWMDYWDSKGLIALGGVEGNIVVVDCAAMKVVNSSHAHSSEIIQIYFYSQEHQIISVAKNGTILVWDMTEMNILQSFKGDYGLRFSMFDPTGWGTLYTTTHLVKKYHAKVDPEIELKALQVRALAKDFKNQETLKAISKPFGKKSLIEEDSKIKESKNSNVLITDTSSLVYLEFMESHSLIITVDSKNLVRLWDIESGNSHSSYNISIPGQVTAANIDKENGLIAVGNHTGHVKIWNIFSGGLLYDLPEAPCEITELKFVKAITDISLVGTCWDGKVMMWTQPNEERNYQIDGICSIGHRGDIIWIDSDEKYIATGGADGLVSVWSILSGMLIHSFPVPVGQGRKPATVSNNVVQVKLVKKQSNLLYVCHETGDIHWVDASNGNENKYFAAKAAVNSNWALDKDKEIMMVVGDTGKAILFKVNEKNENWSVIKRWSVHNIATYDSTYVWSVKSSHEYDMFMTATINGSVKLWSIDGDYIADINQSDWPEDILSMAKE
jgi:WD40 repeat protein